MRRGIQIAAHGGAEALQIIDLPPLQLQPGEVEVRVSHVALNHLDVWVRRGVPGHDFHLPKIPGSDVAGVTADGQRVALHPSWGCGTCPACLDGRHNRCPTFRLRGETVDGGCVTTLAVPESHLLPVPAHLSLAEAASLPLALLTAWHMLVERARLQRHERVLVQGGASGVGVMAIQIARLFGCEVDATASSPERLARVAALGARPLMYHEVPASTYDVVVEHVGEATWKDSVRALKWGARLVTCGATTGAKASINLRALFFKQLDLLGSTMGTMGDMRRAWAEVSAGAIRPVVDRVLPMSQIAEGHKLLEERAVVGKVVLEQDLLPNGAAECC